MSAIALGAFHGCAIRRGDRRVECWGSDWDGKASPPTELDAVGADAIACGLSHSCAARADSGAVVCWGGERTPVPPQDLRRASGGVAAMDAGGEQTLAILAPEPSSGLCAFGGLGALAWAAVLRTPHARRSRHRVRGLAAAISAPSGPRPG